MPDPATPEELNARLLEQIVELRRELQLLQAENNRLRAAAQDVVEANRESLSASASGNVNDATMTRLALDARVRVLEKALRSHPS